MAELRALRLGRKAVERLCTLGVLRRVARGVYVLVTSPLTLEHRCRLLCCLHPSGFVTGPMAAMLGGLRRQPPRSALHFSVRHGWPSTSPPTWRRWTTGRRSTNFATVAR